VCDPSVNCVFDQAAHNSRIAQHFVSGNPQYGESSFGQIPVATRITFATFFRLMVFAIDLDD
jgi:hypothetical protein